MSLTLKRVLAYFFDIIMISMISGMISMTTINPYYEASEELRSEYESTVESYNSRISEIDESDEEGVNNLVDEMMTFYKAYIWKSNKYSIFGNVVSMVLLLLYFVVFAYFFDGETVGKRMMKLKVVAVDEKKVGMFSLFIRALILHGIPLALVNMLLPFMMEMDSFVVVSSVIYVLTFALEIAIIITTFANKNNRGLHDLIAKTRVIERN